MTFDACFDKYSKTIFLRVDRNIYSQDNISSFLVYFEEEVYRNFTLDKLPEKGDFKIYYLNSENNPLNLLISLSLEEENICKEPLRVFVRDCTSSNQDTVDTQDKRNKEVDLRAHIERLEYKKERWKEFCKSSFMLS